MKNKYYNVILNIRAHCEINYFEKMHYTKEKNMICLKNLKLNDYKPYLRSSNIE